MTRQESHADFKNIDSHADVIEWYLKHKETIERCLSLDLDGMRYELINYIDDYKIGWNAALDAVKERIG